jgi:hypothetical protein
MSASPHVAPLDKPPRALAQGSEATRFTKNSADAEKLRARMRFKRRASESDSALLRQDFLREQGLSRTQADCLIARLRPLLERYRLENFERVTDDRRFRAAVAAAGLICIGPNGPQGTAPPDQS